MKIIIKSLAGVMLCTLFAACHEQDIQVYHSPNAIYFGKYYTNEKFPGTAKADSTITSFFFLEDNINSIEVPLKVLLAGKKLKKDFEFHLAIDKEATTATNEEYVLADHYVFKAKKHYTDEISDTIYFTLKRSERTGKENYRIVLNIVPQTNLIAGQYERRKAVIYVNKEPVRPEWWNKEIDVTLLGTYTPKKYKLLLKYVPESHKINKEFISNHPDMMRKIVLDFKKWLTENPQKEEDGYDMEISI